MKSSPECITDLLNQWNKQSDDAALCYKIIEKAENIIEKNETNLVEKKVWFKFLKITRKPDFLIALASDSIRKRWTEIVFKIIQHTDFSLLDLFIQRVTEHPKKILFQDRSTAIPGEWSYENIFRHIKEIAALFHTVEKENPRVVIFCDNSVESACCDLACLCFDIFDTPLNIHFNKEILTYVIKQLKISIVVVDTKERFKIISELKKEHNLTFKIFTILSQTFIHNECDFLGEKCKQFDFQQIDSILSQRKVKPINQVATTMFTSGSTGMPKGVSFSIYNLVSKRFARAAAVPKIGNNEIFLCFLPLFHTFGRYLELLGSIYWSGTYVFAGNPSAETLLSLFPKVNPSIFISIPLRWLNLYEKCIESIGIHTNIELKQKIFRETVGSNLCWGLSAAGYLDPKIFRFFNEYGVELCSGFGMTEATGGITMTPPSKYKENSVGIPLPGVNTRLKETKELELSGHYIAKYLEDAGTDDIIPFPESAEKDYWMGTGDIFTISDDGFHEIVDRVKDIYKNNKGQTIAPQVIEKKFTGVPGIKRTFLVGDARPYNVLLIIPDYDDEFIKSASNENRNEYFHQIVMIANKDVAPYERVINFSLLERDFFAEKDELTPKGTFNRKIIEKNFETLINSLYVSNTITIDLPNLQIQIPRWFFRDLGILETDITFIDTGLYNRRNNTFLPVLKTIDNRYLIGNYEYSISGKIIDLGIFARQPRLWIGNPALIKFSPVKDGWDIPVSDFSDRVYYHVEKSQTEFLTNFPQIKGINDSKLIFINNLLSTAVFAEPAIAISALKQIGSLFNELDSRYCDVIRRRLEALAYHPTENLRILAYQTLLLDETNPDYSKTFPVFVQSGLSFLNEDSIHEIASHNVGRQQLESLRQRLYSYRVQLNWPVDEVMRNSFINILKLLFNFASKNSEYFVSVRAELASWILHKTDSILSKVAEDLFYQLNQLFKTKLEEKTPDFEIPFWESKLIFENIISQKEIDRLKYIFPCTPFIQESVVLAFKELDFSMSDIIDSGIWITRLQSYKEYRHYRMSINTKHGKHYDLHLVVLQNLHEKPNPETVYWQASIANYAYGLPILPNLGCSYPQLGILSTQYIGSLSVWDKIREFSDVHKSAGKLLKPNTWRKLFIKAFATFFKAWHNSGFQIIPGIISANNVVVPDLDFRENATIVSLSAWKPYENTISLIYPMVHDFYCKTAALYPWSKKQLDVTWIFDACIEALGVDKANEFFNQLAADLLKNPVKYFGDNSLYNDLDDYTESLLKKYYIPLALYNAIEQYKEWEVINPFSTTEAKEQTIFELFELYKLYRYPEIIRYYLYRYTYFADIDFSVKDVFDSLLAKMCENVKISPIQLIELSDLQAMIINQDDKQVFIKMVFPKIQKEQKVDLIKIGEHNKEQVIVRSHLKNKKGETFIFREPINPSEVGQLYQLFFKENYPKEISKYDKQLIITDSQDTVIGGLCYKILDNNIVLLDGSVIKLPLQGNGLGTAMIEDFFSRMANQGVKMIKAHFLFGNYYLKHNFQVDKKWGALVKCLE